MITIFVSHAKEDSACAEAILQDLEARGYAVWREPASLSMESILYPRTIESVILSSAAVILVWSSSAAQSEWVERHLLFAQQLKKPLFPVLIDGTALSNTLITDTPLTNQDCTDIVAHLPPDFPSPQSTHPLIALSEQAAHDFIRTRKDAIDQAAEMLKPNEDREAVLAILEYLAHNDLMMGVRERAQEVLNIDAKKDVSPPFIRPDESRHIFGVRCKNGHVSYFDKRRVCSAYKEVPRDIRQSADLELDELHLTCDTCREIVVARVDCRGYK